MPGPMFVLSLPPSHHDHRTRLSRAVADATPNSQSIGHGVACMAPKFFHFTRRRRRRIAIQRADGRAGNVFKRETSDEYRYAESSPETSLFYLFIFFYYNGGKKRRKEPSVDNTTWQGLNDDKGRGTGRTLCAIPLNLFLFFISRRLVLFRRVTRPPTKVLTAAPVNRAIRR